MIVISVLNAYLGRPHKVAKYFENQIRGADYKVSFDEMILLLIDLLCLRWCLNLLVGLILVLEYSFNFKFWLRRQETRVLGLTLASLCNKLHFTALKLTIFRSLRKHANAIYSNISLL